MKTTESERVKGERSDESGKTSGEGDKILKTKSETNLKKKEGTSLRPEQRKKTTLTYTPTPIGKTKTKTKDHKKKRNYRQSASIIHRAISKQKQQRGRAVTTSPTAAPHTHTADND